MSTGRGALFVFALFAVFSMMAPVIAADDTRPLSPAQIALFESDHLGTIRQAERLEYRFARETAARSDDIDSFTDRIEIDVRPRTGSSGKDVWTDFLSAEHHMSFPPLMDFHGNPVIMFFLERDVGEMHRLTGGSASYFRNRIREAFIDRAQVTSINVTRDGSSLPATEIVVTPFEQDQHVAVFPGLAEKRYRFVLSEAVPGRIVEIASEAPSKSGQFSTKETLTFAGEGPCVGDIGPCAPTTQQ